MKRNYQQRGLNGLDRQRSRERRVLRFQGNVTQRMDMEHALVVIRQIGIGWRPTTIVSGCGVVIMMVIVTVHSGMVIEVDVRRQRVDAAPVLFVNLVRMRLRGAS